ncbi:MAG: hypothetical protein ACOWWH_09740 [Eubacteriaceae bacterium]
MQKFKYFGVVYIIIINLITDIFLFTISNRIFDIVINSIVGLLGLYIIQGLGKQKRKISEIIFILSIYNLMIAGSMFFSSTQTNNTIIDTVSLNVFVFSLIIMLSSAYVANRTKPYHVKQFYKWSITGVMFGTFSIFAVVLMNKVNIDLLKISLLIVCVLSFILMFFSIYKVEHSRNKM